MRAIALVLFLFALLWIGYVFAGYPLLVRLLGWLRPYRHLRRDDYLPIVSVLLSARNEERDILWKVEQTLAWDYPADRLQVLVASDASDDSTDEILRGIADPRFRFVRMEPRTGKNGALNRLAQLATGELFLFTDANSYIPPGCLRRLVRHFADPIVGCVTGTERTIGRQQQALAGGSRAYLDYESRINAWESRLGSVLVCDGSIFCILGKLYRPLQHDVANDLEIPLRIGREGWALVYESDARSSERATRSLKQEFDRRRRICAQGALGAWRLRECLHGLRGWQFLSRKVLRWFVVVPMTLLLASTAALARQPLFAVLLLAQLLFYGLAAWAAWQAARGQTTPRWLSLPLYFTLAGVAAFTGVVESCLGRRFSVWEIPTLSRGGEETA